MLLLLCAIMQVQRVTESLTLCRPFIHLFAGPRIELHHVIRFLIRPHQFSRTPIPIPNSKMALESLIWPGMLSQVGFTSKNLYLSAGAESFPGIASRLQMQSGSFGIISIDTSKE